MSENPLESLWNDRCRIFEFEKVFNGSTKRTENKLIEKEKGIKCRISYNTLKSVESTDSHGRVNQVIKLILDPNIAIKPNSVIEVEKVGVLYKFKNSGIPAIYTNHQEVILINYKKET